MNNKQMVLDYLSENYLSRYGTLYNFEDFEEIKMFRFNDDENDEEQIFNEDILIDTIETSLIVTSIYERSPTLKIGALINSDVILYYKGENFREIATHLAQHPHFQELIRRKTDIPIIKESYGQIKDFYNHLNFQEYLENIEYAWMIFNGYDPYERSEFGDQFYNIR